MRRHIEYVIVYEDMGSIIFEREIISSESLFIEFIIKYSRDYKWIIINRVSES